MRKVLFGFFGLGMLVFVLAAVASRPPQERQLPPATPTVQEPSLGENAEGQAVVDGQAVEELKAQLKKKDALIASLLAAKLKEASAETPVVRADQRDRRMEAMRVLDERMAQASSNSSEAKQMHDAVRAALAAGSLASTAMTDLRCAGRLCRLAISDHSQDQVEMDTQKVSQSVAKTVGGLVVLDGEEGEKIIYLARSSDDLAVTPTPADVPHKRVR
jgi:hypothetical protein